MSGTTSSSSAEAMPAAKRPRRRRALGAKTLLLTHKRATLGEMSCNPAIGGVGKGHLVREIDAADGLMGRVADAAGIQFRILNRRKGPAVRGPRAQADRKLYRQAMQAALGEATDNLEIREGGRRGSDPVGRPRGAVWSRRTARTLRAGAVVLTTGTFLNGLIHMRRAKNRRRPRDRRQRASSSGEGVEAPSIGLSQTLYGLGFAMGRLKTGHASAPGWLDHRLGTAWKSSRATIRPRLSRS